MSVVFNFSQGLRNLNAAKSKYFGRIEINSLFLVINTVLLLISCQNSPSTEQNLVFRYNSSTGISSLDPAFARTQENIRAVNQIFNGLLQLDSELKLAPAIAKNWSVDSSGKLYTFKLRRDVLFHNHPLFKNREERTVNAGDFVYSFNRIMDPGVASDGAWIFNGIVEDSLPFWASNDSTFHILLKEPFSPFLNMLTMAYCSVVPSEIVEGDPNFSKQPVGTGPFMFANWIEGVRLNLLRNPEYFESTPNNSIPKVDAVSVTFIESKQTALLKFMQGDIDVFTGLESSFKDLILTGDGDLQPKYKGDIKLMTSPFLNTEYLAFNLENPQSPFLNRDLRLAINHAIDRKSMIRYMRNSIGIPAKGGFIPQGLPGTIASDRLQFDPELAKSYVEKVPEHLRSFTLSTTKEYHDLCVLIQKDLANVGLECEIDVIPSSLLKQQKSSGDLFFFRSSWIADYPDAENYMACFYSKNKAPFGPNYSRFVSPVFDSLYIEMVKETEDNQKLKLLAQMENILINDAAFVLLFYDESIWLLSNRIEGFSVNALNHLNLKTVTKSLKH